MIPAPGAAQPGVAPVAQPTAVPQQRIPSQSNSLLQALLSAPAEEQRNMLGERLYPEILRLQPDRAGKITGMLLEMEVSELLNLLESGDALRQKVAEAVAVLDTHTK